MIGRVRLFDDRHDAGYQLAAALRHLRDEHPVVLALPRGGVPVAFEVARALGAPLDILLVRKIGVPGHEELALGAIIDGTDPQMVLNEEVLDLVAVDEAYIAAARQRELGEIERRRRLYRRDGGAIPLVGRSVIIIDDGIATGATVKVAMRGVRLNQPRRLVLAVPVAPAEAIKELAAECDEIVCLATPEPFYAVGTYYADFDQTSDAEVVALLAAARDTPAEE